MFLQIEQLTCPLMYIVGGDDLSTSSIENANLVDFFLFSIVLFHCHKSLVLESIY